MSISGREGVVHQQPVSTFWQPPLDVELQLGARGSLEVPHAREVSCVRARKSHRTAGHYVPVAVTVLMKNMTQTEAGEAGTTCVRLLKPILPICVIKNLMREE